MGEIIVERLRLISYGNGAAFDPAKFEPMRNRDFVKPLGGLWASPVGTAWGWREWCMVESYGDLSTSFTFWLTGRVFLIDSYHDLTSLPWINPFGVRSLFFLDFETIAKDRYDAIWLTEKGQEETRLSLPLNLYGWDCECVLILNPAAVMI